MRKDDPGFSLLYVVIMLVIITVVAIAAGSVFNRHPRSFSETTKTVRKKMMNSPRR